MNKKLKIAIIGSRGYPYVYSGYETLVKELSERLVSKGHNVRVYCHRSLFREKPRYINGIELIYTPSIETKFLSQIVNSFFSFIHVCFSNVDTILVVNSANGPFGFLTKIFRKKACINVDGLEWLRPKWKGFGSIYYLFASKLCTIFYDKIITDSNQMMLVYKDKFNVESDVIAYGPSELKIRNNYFLEEKNLKKDEYFLLVGRLIPDNNSEIIIKGFLKSSSTKKLVIVGDVPYNDIYANKVKDIKNKNIVFTGYINDTNDLMTLYRNCFGYVHGHEYGGTNPTMINALDLNCQIIALETEFNKEMLKNKEAIFFTKTVEDIEEKFSFFEKKIKQLKQKNRNYSLPKIYDWDYITKQYISLFYNLTNFQNK